MKHKFLGAWCFSRDNDGAGPVHYYPFAGAENFVPQSSDRPDRGLASLTHLFPWGLLGPKKESNSAVAFLDNHSVNFDRPAGDRARPVLRGRVKEIHYQHHDGIFERCLFSFTPYNHPRSLVYVFSVRADQSHFVDKQGICDVYLSCKISDIHLGFPEIFSSPPPRL